MACGQGIDQISFTVPYLGLSDSADSTYAGKAGFMVTVNPSATGTVLAAMPMVPDVSVLVTSVFANSTYATINSLTATNATVSGLSTSVTTLSGTVTTLSTTVASNAAAIAILTASPHFYRNGTAVPPTTGSFRIGDYFIANQT